jgi:hypothetical protein
MASGWDVVSTTPISKTKQDDDWSVVEVSPISEDKSSEWDVVSVKKNTEKVLVDPNDPSTYLDMPGVQRNLRMMPDREPGLEEPWIDPTYAITGPMGFARKAGIKATAKAIGASLAMEPAIGGAQEKVQESTSIPDWAKVPINIGTGVVMGDILTRAGRGATKIAGVSAQKAQKGMRAQRKSREYEKFLDAAAPNLKKVHDGIDEIKNPFSLSGAWAKFNETWLDRFHVLGKGVQKRTVDDNGMEVVLKLPATEEAYKEARTFAAYKDDAGMKLAELQDALRPVRDGEAIFTDYVAAWRDRSRALAGFKNPNDVRYPEATRAMREAEKLWRELGRDPQDLRNAARNFSNWANQHILGGAVESGFITKEAADKIRQTNSFYAAFEILEKMPKNINDIPTMSLPTKEYFSRANQDIIKKMTGTTKKTSNPIETTLSKFMKAELNYAQNKVANAFVDDPVIKDFIRPVAKSIRELKALKAQGKNPVMQGVWNKREFDTINRFKNGKVEQYLVPTEYADAMKQLTPQQANKYIRVANSAFRQAATTLYLPFTVGNIARDVKLAYTTTPAYTAKLRDLGVPSLFKFTSDVMNGLYHGAKWEFLKHDDIVQGYLRSGGGFGYSGEIRHARQMKSELFKKRGLSKYAQPIRTTRDLLEKISSAVELAPRIAVYRRSIKQGQSAKDAAFSARSSTIDFSRGGRTMKVLNQWVPFLNARVQGRLRLVEGLRGDPKGTGMKIAMTTILPAVSAYAWNRTYYSDLYEDIPEWVKQNYFTFIYGEAKDEDGKTVPKYFVFAKGDADQMVANPIEFALDSAYKRDRVTATKFLTDWISDISPVQFAREGELSGTKALGSLLPPPAKAVVEPLTNTNFYFGNEVVPTWMEKRPPELQYYESTPDTYKKAGKALGLSPLKIQNVMSNLFAGYGRSGFDPHEVIKNLAGRMVKTKGGAKENKAWDELNNLEQEYQFARERAIAAAKNENFDEVNKLIRQWNEQLPMRIAKYNSQMENLKADEFMDRGGLARAYLFTPQKIKNIYMKSGDEPFTAIEKRLIPGI